MYMYICISIHTYIEICIQVCACVCKYIYIYIVITVAVFEPMGSKVHRLPFCFDYSFLFFSKKRKSVDISRLAGIIP